MMKRGRNSGKRGFNRRDRKERRENGEQWKRGGGIYHCGKRESGKAETLSDRP